MSKYLVGLLLCLLASSVQAVPDAMVQAVQMPAWLQRGNVTQPLRVGQSLLEGDKVMTGQQARVYIQTADGSTVKLGERAILNIRGLAQQNDAESLFSAALEVAKGAFRFTTAAAAKLRARDVTIKVANATLGIRGTDVWGKDGKDDAGTEMGVVCLIEGNIAVVGEDKKVFTMDQPLSFYKMPKGAPALAVSAVKPEQLNKWAAETDLSEPAPQLEGKWKVNLLTTADEASALAAYDQWRDAGYDVHINPVAHEGAWQYTLQITQLASAVAAKGLAAQLKGNLGAENPSVSR